MRSIIALFLFITLTFCFEENSYNSTITFSTNEIKSSGEGVEISDTTATINKAGSYLVTGKSEEGNIIISVESVNLYLENLELSSKKTSPIIVNSKLNDIKIISIENVILNDYEDSSTTTGECATIKIKKKSKVIFQNKKDFKLTGDCKNVIKGGAQASIIFSSSNGEYTIVGNKTAIASDGLLKFNGGKFNVTTKTGDAIKSSPEDDDTDSLGKLIINDGIFNIQSFSDAFQAKNKILIKNGTFNIKTENGYQSKTFDKDTGSAKGFKVSNNATGCEIRVSNGNFSLNTADDSFHSNGNLTIINGNYLIYSKDDGLHAEFHLLIGKKDSTIGPNINILYSYEAIEGMSIRIYSGKINATATDDGLNAAGGSSSDESPFPPHLLREGPKPGPSGGGNSSYFISFYGGEINVFCDGDGLDSNGNVFIHGGDINIFSKTTGDNEPIDHDGNFTLFSATVLGVGSKGMEYVHNGISKGNQMYAYYSQSISKNKILKIKNGDGDIVKQGNITKNIDYIFYTSPDLDNKHELYICDSNGSNEKKYSLTFKNPTSGSDDQDKSIDDGGAEIDDEDADEKDDGEGGDSDDDGEGGDGDDDGKGGDGDDDGKGGDGDDDGKRGDGDDDGKGGNGTKTFLICFFSILIPLILIILLIVFLRRRKSKKFGDEQISNITSKLVES